jgi:ATP-dependent helicase HrpA
VIEVSGRTYPVETRYRPSWRSPSAGGPRDRQHGHLDAVDELAPEGPGDVLVFLPGEREIRDTAEALRASSARSTEVLPLYARLSPPSSTGSSSPTGGRRIVLATNVAETSLTVPGIRYVVDPGPRASAATAGAQGAAPADRTGLAGSSATSGPGAAGGSPGVCIRLYAEDDFDPARSSPTRRSCAPTWPR